MFKTFENENVIVIINDAEGFRRVYQKSEGFIIRTAPDMDMSIVLNDATGFRRVYRNPQE